MQTNSNTRQFVENDLDAENVGKSQPLGHSQERVGNWSFPEFVITAASGGVTFQKTTAEIGPIVAFIAKQRTYPVGALFDIFGENGLSDGRFTFKNIKDIKNVKAKIRGACRVLYDITSTAYAEIKQAETEHLADFEQAFALTLKQVADAINQLAGTSYQNGQQAIQALVTVLQDRAPQLIPQDPYDFLNWKSRLLEVIDALTSQSLQKRDAKDHLAQGYTATANSSTSIIALEPVFENSHREARDIIRLEEVPIVFQAQKLTPREPAQMTQRPATLTPGSQAQLKQQIKRANFYSKPEDVGKMKETFYHSLDAYTVVTIVNVTEQGVVVSVEKEANSGIDPAVFDHYSEQAGTQKFYTFVNMSELVAH